MTFTYHQKPTAIARTSRRGLSLFLFTWLPVLVMVTAIAIESTHTFSAAHTSSWLRTTWQAIFGAVSDERWEVVHHSIRKTGHFTGYGLLAAASLRAWLIIFARKLPSIPLAGWRWRSAALGLACTAFVASCDEFHQYFMPDRTGTIHDVLLDTFGGTCFLLVIALLFWTSKPSE